MTMTNFPAFLGILLVTYVVPGPDFVVVSTAALRSARAGFWTAVGVLCGLAVHTSAAVLGLSVLVASSQVAFEALRIAGAAWLIYLGVRLLASRVHAPSGPARPALARAAWWRGFVCNVSNPKAVLFFLSLMPQFVDPHRAIAPQTLLLSAIVIAVGAVWWTLVCWLALRSRRWLTSARVARRIDRAGGAALVALGGTIAAS
jgi:threonine/homoserine/homoserine lactone efflux protein